MKKFSLDFETFLIQPGCLAPDPVCLSFASSEGAGLLHARLERDEVVRVLRERLEDEGVALFGANTAFDMGVALQHYPELRSQIFAAYDAGRVFDVQIDEQLDDIARGELGGRFYREDGKTKRESRSYSLAALETRHLGIDRSGSKNDVGAWRLRYGTLADVPLDQWEPEAVDYAIADAEGTLAVAEKLEAQRVAPREERARQACAHLALHLASAHGAMTDPAQIDLLEKKSARRFELLTQLLQADTLEAQKAVHLDLLVLDSGAKTDEDFELLENENEERFSGITAQIETEALVRADGSCDTKKARARIAAVYEAQGLDVKLTATGQKKYDEGDDASGYESLDEEACDQSGDPVLEAYAERVKLRSIVQTHIPALRMGVTTPIQPGYKVLVDSGRTSCLKGKPGGSTNGYQVQNIRRAPGLRECFTARPGKLYGDADFGGLELCTVAQVCKSILGKSALADALNEGIDVHLDMAAQLLGISYAEAHERRHEKVVKDARQLSKPANFGFPGGLGPKGFVAFARAYKLVIDERKAKELKAAWLRRWPEFREYFDWINTLQTVDGDYQVSHLFTGRVRGGMTYTSACNNNFQGLGADGAKAALWAVTRASYDPAMESELFGFRPIFFVHDQIVGETKDLDSAHEQAVELGRVMIDACNQFLPDVPVRCEPCLSKHFTKDAVAVYDAPPHDGGRLLPWDLARDAKTRCFYSDGKAVAW